MKETDGKKSVIDIHPSIDPDIFHHLTQIERERRNESTRAVPICEARGVKKSFGSNLVIPGLDFTVDDIEGKSEIISVLGPSGSGKSTVLNLIAGLITPTEGKLLANGNEITGPGTDRGMIFQKYSSFPFLTVIENIMYPLVYVKRMKARDARERAQYWIDRMYLKGAEKKYPSQLSGGMQQRVAIARTLCMDARIILMDEPFGALDRKIRWEMQDLMAEIVFFKPEQEITVFLVTHDIPEAVFLGDRIWVINHGSLESETYIGRPTESARLTQTKKEFVDMVSFFNEKIFSLELAAEV
jgi:ABC-type nitrate/sulfonate/bicarbonate transport system ATPase subunit